jgi:signal transduction histidine kinase
VLLEFQPDVVILEIQDDGVGFDASQPPKDGRHFGLHGIRERTKRLDGTLEVRSELNFGTQIRVNVPVNVARENISDELKT